MNFIDKAEKYSERGPRLRGAGSVANVSYFAARTEVTVIVSPLAVPVTVALAPACL